MFSYLHLTLHSSPLKTPLFLEIGSVYNSLRVKQLGFTVFKSILPILWFFFKNISNHTVSGPIDFLSIYVFLVPTMEVNGTRLWGSSKMSPLPKKVEYPFKTEVLCSGNLWTLKPAFFVLIDRLKNFDIDKLF